MRKERTSVVTGASRAKPGKFLAPGSYGAPSNVNDDSGDVQDQIGEIDHDLLFDGQTHGKGFDLSSDQILC